MDASIKDFIVRYVAANTRSFGGGKVSAWNNPISAALRDYPPQFAAGVDIGEVVDLVFKAIEEAKKQSKATSKALTKLKI